MEYDPLLLLASALTGALLTWLLTFYLLRQKYHMLLDTQRYELKSRIALLEAELDMANRSYDKYQQERNRSIKLSQLNAILGERIEGLNEKVKQFEKMRERYTALEALHENTKLELSTALSTNQSKLSELEKYLTIMKGTLKESQEKTDHLQNDLAASKSYIRELETNLENEQKNSKEKLELLQRNKEQMKMEFRELADSILKNNSEQFSNQNTRQLSEIMTPIKEQFSAFKKQIDEVYIKEAKERSLLQGEINHIKEINLQMSQEARNLTNALKGESKTQGIWGEMILERVLENSGLINGESYRREVSLEHESDNNRYRPDVVVYLPDKREIIIDAKTSLKAYEQYISSEEEEEKRLFADRHILSIKRHVRELSDKDYTGLKGLKTLDFVLMFIPVESALLMAMEYDPSLFDFAFKKNVILVGPTTLMVALRAVENTWKQEHQQRNALEIAKRAGLLFDKFVGFVESIEKMGKQIDTLQKRYDEVYGKLHTGAGSITGQFQKLEKLGAAASKHLPEHIIREIEES